MVYATTIVENIFYFTKVFVFLKILIKINYVYIRIQVKNKLVTQKDVSDSIEKNCTKFPDHYKKILFIHFAICKIRTLITK